MCVQTSLFKLEMINVVRVVRIKRVLILRQIEMVEERVFFVVLMTSRKRSHRLRSHLLMSQFVLSLVDMMLKLRVGVPLLVGIVLQIYHA